MRSYIGQSGHLYVKVRHSQVEVMLCSKSGCILIKFRSCNFQGLVMYISLLGMLLQRSLRYCLHRIEFLNFHEGINDGK